jgi:hypothetical protein
VTEPVGILPVENQSSFVRSTMSGGHLTSSKSTKTTMILDLLALCQTEHYLGPHLIAFRSGVRSSAAEEIFLIDAVGAKCDFGKIAPSLKPRRSDCRGKAVLTLARVDTSSGFCSCNRLVRAMREG